MQKRGRGKKGIELSVNFFVIVVLSVVILGFGLKLLYDVIAKTEPLFPQECTDQRIDVMLASSRVAVCPSAATIARGKSGSFLIGILNTDVPAQFLVSISAAGAVDRNDNLIISAPLNDFKFTYKKDYIIPQNTDKKLAVIAAVPKSAPKGTYIIDVLVCSGTSKPASCALDNSYDAVQKVYVNVP